MNANDTPRLGIVIPTVGTRKEFLSLALMSIQECNIPITLAIVAPRPFLNTLSIPHQHVLVEDSGRGLAHCVNQGIESLRDCEFLSILGDDDLLDPDGVAAAYECLRTNEEAVAVFGGCTYIDQNSSIIWTNQSSQLAVPLARFGPNLIPLPGSLLRRSSVIAAGKLNTKYKWAWDLDLFIRLSKVGPVIHISVNTGFFRWHRDSLTVKSRKMSAKEASEIRRSHLPEFLRPLSHLWELPVRTLVVAYGRRISRGSIQK